MKKTVIIVLSLASFASFGAINYQTKEECVKAMDQYIKSTETLSDDLSFDYWAWFQGFKRSASNRHETCTDGQCIQTLDFGGCGSADNPILFNLIKPQLEDEINRMEAKQPSLKGLNTKVVCRYKAGKAAVTSENCNLQP